MNFEELPEDLQEEVRALKHGSVTIESDVECALESTESLEEFRSHVDNSMDEIISEAQGVRMTLGTGKRSVVHV